MRLVFTMRVVCIDVVIPGAALRAATLEDLGRAVWLAMAARLTGDARWAAVANHHLEETLAYAIFVEGLLGSPEIGSYDCRGKPDTT
jgi:hypothetical protein